MGANTVIKDLGFVPEEEWEQKTLPDASDLEDGMVLAVNDGIWEPAEPSGGTGGGGVVTVIATPIEDDEAEIDASYNDLKEALEQYLYPLVLFYYSSGYDEETYMAPLTRLAKEEEDGGKKAGGGAKTTQNYIYSASFYSYYFYSTSPNANMTTVYPETGDDV